MKKTNLLLPFALILARWKKEVCLLLPADIEQGKCQEYQAEAVVPFLIADNPVLEQEDQKQDGQGDADYGDLFKIPPYTDLFVTDPETGKQTLHIVMQNYKEIFQNFGGTLSQMLGLSPADGDSNMYLRTYVSG